MKKSHILMVLGGVIFILSLMALGEQLLEVKGLEPKPGSKIKSIENYNQTPTNRIGSVIIKGARKNVMPRRDDKFKYLAVSEKLPYGSFDKEAYDKNHIGEFSYVNGDHNEGIEVVDIYTNNPQPNIAPYCH